MEHVGSQRSRTLRVGRLPRIALTLWMTLLGVSMFGSACKGSKKKTESQDAGSDQAPATKSDAGHADAGATRRDAGATPDLIGKVDASKGEEPPVLGPCDLVTKTFCPSEGCPHGSACVAKQCGGTECVEGRACVSDVDCSTSDCDEASGHCQPDAGDCTSARDCALGFECEDSTCVDRRIPCWSAKRQVCPQGYICFSPNQAQGLCARVFEPCDSSSQCGHAGLCSDETLDGHGECVAEGPCPDSCPAGEGCGYEPSSGGREAGCYVTHVCHVDTDCSAQAPTCLKAAADGPGQCAPAKGKCSSNDDCPSPSICAMEFLGAAPRCIGGSSEL